MRAALSLSTSKKTRRTHRRRWIILGVIAVMAFLSSAASVAFHTTPACGGGYPEKWCNVPIDTVVDNWGMYNRECVSYTAWKVASSGRHMPYGFGDANNWPKAAQHAGIPVDEKPRVGDVAIRFDNKFGHSMYVESVHADGTLTVSQYNVNSSGGYSVETIKPSGLVFIHF